LSGHEGRFLCTWSSVPLWSCLAEVSSVSALHQPQFFPQGGSGCDPAATLAPGQGSRDLCAAQTCAGIGFRETPEPAAQDGASSLPLPSSSLLWLPHAPLRRFPSAPFSQMQWAFTSTLEVTVVSFSGATGPHLSPVMGVIQ
jgi:hypothetical protein